MAEGVVSVRPDDLHMWNPCVMAQFPQTVDECNHEGLLRNTEPGEDKRRRGRNQAVLLAGHGQMACFGLSLVNRALCRIRRPPMRVGAGGACCSLCLCIRAVKTGEGRGDTCKAGVESDKPRPLVMPNGDARFFRRRAEIYDTNHRWRFVEPWHARGFCATDLDGRDCEMSPGDFRGFPY